MICHVSLEDAVTVFVGTDTDVLLFLGYAYAILKPSNKRFMKIGIVDIEKIVQCYPICHTFMLYLDVTTHSICHTFMLYLDVTAHSICHTFVLYLDVIAHPICHTFVLYLDVTAHPIYVTHSCFIWM